MAKQNTRDVATTLRKLADFLDTRPEFNIEYYYPGHFSFYDKDNFTIAAKAIGDATKVVDEGEYANFKLVSKLAPVTLSISRDKVCRKSVVYECEPLFSPEEVEAL